MVNNNNSTGAAGHVAADQPSELSLLVNMVQQMGRQVEMHSMAFQQLSEAQQQRREPDMPRHTTTAAPLVPQMTGGGERQRMVNKAIQSAIAPAGGIGPVLMRPRDTKSSISAFARFREFAKDLKLTFEMVGIVLSDHEKLARITRWGSTAKVKHGRDSVDTDAYDVILTWKDTSLPPPSGAVHH
jgi:hypothetical protein